MAFSLKLPQLRSFSCFFRSSRVRKSIRAPRFFPAMSTSASSDFLNFLTQSYPSAITSAISKDDVYKISRDIFRGTSYTDNDQEEIIQWLRTISTSLTKSEQDEEPVNQVKGLQILNNHLSTRTTILGTKPSVADLNLYFRIAPVVKTWTSEQRTGEHGSSHLVRFFDFVQNAPLFGLSLKEEDKTDIDVNDIRFVHKPLDPKEEKERKKKEKAATAGSAVDTKKQTSLPIGKDKEQDSKKNTQATSSTDAEPSTESPKPSTSISTPSPKKVKKEKPAKTPKPTPVETPLSPCLIDLRVGHILRAIPHPNADSLYVSTIACGDPPDTANTTLDSSTGKTVRTVCSGLNGLIPLADLQGRSIVAVCNLKPVTMRGIKSAAMVLAASPRVSPGEEDSHKGPVELVDPPAGATAGERVYFEGWEGEPESVLNPKKKIWETLQPAFTTTGELEVGFDAGVVDGLKKGDGTDGVAKLRTKDGVCLVQSLKEATVR